MVAASMPCERYPNEGNPANSTSNWCAVTRFEDDGRMEAHNNIAERALRGVANRRKNYRHLGWDSGVERAAAIYSLLGTAKLNGLNPPAYLRHLVRYLSRLGIGAPTGRQAYG